VSADGGRLLLDEIRELGPTAQAGLLRFLDDQQVRPVGGHSLRRVDVQLLAATHADLEAEVAARRFRADLFYRLHTVAVRLPPLRQRTDLHEVLDHTLERLERQATLSLRALARLAQERWPGNFRELRAVLTRALLRCSHQHIDIDDVLRVLGPGTSTATRNLPTAATARQPAAGTGLPDVQWGNSYALPPAVHTRVTPTRRARPQHPSAPSALQQSATLAVLDEYARNGGIA
jgi:transcriptional regulator of acetoin/glycerol metabolism